MKTCSRCERRLPLDAFYRSKDGRQGRQNYCKRCTVEVQRERYADPVKRTTILAQGQRSRERNREAVSTRIARWREENPEAQRVWTAHHRATRAGVVSTLTRDEWLEILKRFRWCCAYCDGPFESLDHVVPLSRGGANTADNVVPACLSCNSAKQDRSTSGPVYRRIGAWTPARTT